MINELGKPLTKDDLELRVGTCSQKGFTLLLYKTARTDVNRLNEVCGLGWSNSHKVDTKGNVTCSISVYNEDLDIWVTREDTGSESMTEKEKGSYSDSFKRAGFRFGIGIELYKSPFIWVSGRTKDSGRKDKHQKPIYVPDFFTSNLEITDYEVEDGVPHLTIKLNNEVLFSNLGARAVKEVKPKSELGNKATDKKVDDFIKWGKENGKSADEVISTMLGKLILSDTQKDRIKKAYQ